MRRSDEIIALWLVICIHLTSCSKPRHETNYNALYFSALVAAHITDVLQQVLVSVLILRQLLGARIISISTALAASLARYLRISPGGTPNRSRTHAS